MSATDDTPRFGPAAYARLHAILTLIFLVQIPVALLTGLKQSVPYLVFLSLWALVAGHWGAWQATKAEQAQRQANDDGESSAKN